MKKRKYIPNTDFTRDLSKVFNWISNRLSGKKQGKISKWFNKELRK